MGRKGMNLMTKEWLVELQDRVTALEKLLKDNEWVAPEPWHKKKDSAKDGYGIWRHRDGRLDFSKYRFVNGYLEEKVEEGINACVEDSMTHDEYVEHKYEQRAEKQREKYGEADRDEEERRLNEHQGDG